VGVGWSSFWKNPRPRASQLQQLPIFGTYAPHVYSWYFVVGTALATARRTETAGDEICKRNSGRYRQLREHMQADPAAEEVNPAVMYPHPCVGAES